MQAPPLPSPLAPVEEAEYPALTAWRLCSTKAGRGRGLAYAEGFASAAGLPVPRMHAWCVAPDGSVIDPSWSHGEHYLGFVLRRDFAERFMPGLYNGLLGRCMDSPLFAHPVEAWLASPILDQQAS